MCNSAHARVKGFTDFVRCLTGRSMKRMFAICVGKNFQHGPRGDHHHPSLQSAGLSASAVFIHHDMPEAVQHRGSMHVHRSALQCACAGWLYNGLCASIGLCQKKVD